VRLECGDSERRLNLQLDGEIHHPAFGATVREFNRELNPANATGVRSHCRSQFDVDLHAVFRERHDRCHTQQNTDQ
jgi:hypothetical protein